MPKSKEVISTESDTGDSDCDEPKPKKKKEAKAEKVKSPEKQAKPSKSKRGPNGETMFPISDMRYATVSEFRGKVLVSIREYYEKDGKLLPGKKGISLNTDQWESLKNCIDDVDGAIDQL